MAKTVIFETGDNLDESGFQLVNDALTCNTSFIVSGFELSDPTGLFVDVAAGTAFVNGYYINQSAAQTGQALTGSQTNYVWLESDGDLEIETTGTPTDTNAICIGIAVCDGSSITTLTHRSDASYSATSQLTQGMNVVRIKDADTSITSDNTLTADPDLSFTASVREKWHLAYMLIIDQDAATADFQCRVSIPSGGITSFAIGPDDDLYSAATTGTGSAGTATYDHTSGVNGTTHQIQHAALSNTGLVKAEAIIEIGETSGAVDLEWSQITSDANATAVKTGSYLLATRILG